jgi:DNA invertase Pin-like site-specific DNA recombinase
MNEINNLLQNCSVTQNAIIYCRSSTINQNNYNHCSIDTQIFNCREYCKQNSLKVINLLTEVCRANKYTNQKALLKIISNFQNINLIIYDATRFSRCVLDGVVLLNKCKENNIIIHNVKDNYSTINHQGYINFIDGIKNGESESKILSDRIKSSIRYRRSLGNEFGKPPYGFKLEKINKITKFVKNNDEVDIINFARDLYYGCNFNEANKKMLRITGNNIESLFTEPCKKILYGNFTFTMIAEFFNQNNIKNRLKNWTGSSISIIVTTDYVRNKKKLNELYDNDEQSISNNIIV